MPADPPRIAVVGATGAVGREALALLAGRDHPADRVQAVASERSAGGVLPYGEGATVPVLPLDLDALAGTDLVLLAVAAELARGLAPELVRRGSRVVDSSSAFRLEREVPLVVPEVNGALLSAAPPLVAGPNCSTILMVVALEPLRRAFGVERVVVSTYQAVSGAGLAAMRELEDQARAVLAGRDPEPRAFPEPCAFNVFPHESPLDAESGLNEEEQKLIRETRRIWDDPSVRVVPTCARVPVFRSHCQSIAVTLGAAAREDEVRSALSSAPGVQLLDDRRGRVFPSSLRAAGADDVQVGRLRPAPDEPPDAEGRARTFCLWLAGDQLRRGAALNALLIGERLLTRSD